MTAHNTSATILANDMWKKFFLGFSAFIIVIMPWISSSYGQSGDEWVQALYGEHIWNYFTTGDRQALNYDNLSLQYLGQEYYGGFFDYTMAVLHHWFPSINTLVLRHFFNALTGAIMMIFTGLLAHRLSRKWIVGFLALLFIFFSPRLFGESMNNPKDIPFAAGFIVAIYSLVALLQDIHTGKTFRHFLTLAFGFAMSFGVRPAGGMLLIAYLGLFSGIYYLLNKEWRQQLFADKNKAFKKLLLLIIGALFIGYVVGMLTWPWGQQDPVSNPFVALEKMTNRETRIRVLFEGRYKMNNEMPWYYEFKWIMMTSPLIVLAGVVILIMFFAKARAQYGLFALIVVVFGAFFPLLYMIYRHSSVYDTWRHVFFVYTFWCVLSAIGFDVLAEMIKNPKLKMVPYYIAFAGLIPVIVWTVRSHPNQYVYFNEAAGGVKGAFGYYDIDYYQNSGKEAADWIRKNAKPIPGRKIVVLSNMSAFGKYFENDTSWIIGSYGRYGDRHHIEWDYYVTYPRYIPAELMQKGLWPPVNTLHKIEIDGVPLSVIFKNKSKAGKTAFEAYEKKDFANAAKYYGEYVAADNSDEQAFVNYSVSLAYTGQIDAAIAAANKAIALNPYAPEYYELLSQLYGAKGDNANAQTAMAKANELKYDMQE